MTEASEAKTLLYVAATKADDAAAQLAQTKIQTTDVGVSLNNAKLAAGDAQNSMLAAIDEIQRALHASYVAMAGSSQALIFNGVTWLNQAEMNLTDDAQKLEFIKRELEKFIIIVSQVSSNTTIAQTSLRGSASNFRGAAGVL
jgi:hypothetical protein